VLSAPVVSTKADGKADGTKAGIVTRPKIPDTANGDAKFTATTKKPDIAESGNVKLSAEIVVPKKVKSKGAAHPDVEVLEKADPKEMAEHAEGLDLQADANAKPVDKTPKIAASKSVHEENQPVLQAVPIEEPIPPQPISISFTNESSGNSAAHVILIFVGAAILSCVLYTYRKKIMGLLINARHRAPRRNVRYRRLSTGEAAIE